MRRGRSRRSSELLLDGWVVCKPEVRRSQRAPRPPTLGVLAGRDSNLRLPGDAAPADDLDREGVELAEAKREILGRALLDAAERDE